MKRFKNINENDDMGVTFVSNAFINHFMPKASGDNVRVYLYGLKYCFSGEDAFPADADIAGALKISEADVEAAWRYWQEEGIVYINEDNSVDFLNITPLLFGMPIIQRRGKKSKRPTSRKIQEMFAGIENKLSRPLNISEHEIILGWLEDYKFTEQTVTLLIDYSLEREGGRNISYWSAVADNFHDEGITTYDQASRYIEKRRANYRQNKEIMSYLGLFRSPSEPENKLIKKWFAEYEFDMDTVKKACDETVKTDKPSLKYVDSILTAWHNGESAPQAKSIRAAAGAKKTRLRDEHNYDVGALEQALFGESEQE